MRFRALRLTAAVIMTTAACGSLNHARTATSSGDKGEQSASPNIREFPSMDKAYPSSRSHVISLPSRLSADRALKPQGFTPDGKFVAATEDRHHVNHDVILYNPVSRRVERTLHRYPAKGGMLATTQLGDVAADDRYIAWLDGSSNFQFYDWRLFIYDRKTGRERIAAKNTTLVGGEPCPAEATGLKITHGRLWWSACAGRTDHDLTSAVYTMRPTDAHAQLWRRDTTDLWPLATGSYAKVRIHRQGEQADGNQIVRLDGQGKQQSVMIKDTSYFAGSDDLLVWSPSYPDDSSNPPKPAPPKHVHIRLASGRNLQAPHGDGVSIFTTRTFSTWHADAGGNGWLFDARNLTLVRLADCGYSLMANGFLFWSTYTGKDESKALFSSTYHLVKLSDLHP